MDEKNKYFDALKKRALGFEYEEVTTLIEETAHGTKKKIVKTKKYCPPDPATARYLLGQLDTNQDDFEKALKDFEEELKGVTNGNKENKTS